MSMLFCLNPENKEYAENAYHIQIGAGYAALAFDGLVLENTLEDAMDEIVSYFSDNNIHIEQDRTVIENMKENEREYTLSYSDGSVYTTLLWSDVVLVKEYKASDCKGFYANMED